MDNVFGIGLPEFVLILVIAGMVMGPERIARSARTLGRLTARLQAVSRTFFRQLHAELDSVDEGGELRNTVDELNQLRRQVADLRSEVFTLAAGTSADTRQAFRDIKREAEQTIMPPNLGRPDASPAPPAPAGKETPVFRPPSLATATVPAAPNNTNGGSTLARPTPKLPQRLDIAEDPEE
jgi:Sec-independent protein translocase protein TatA